jgi:hypothetical protein
LSSRNYTRIKIITFPYALQLSQTTLILIKKYSTTYSSLYLILFSFSVKDLGSWEAGPTDFNLSKLSSFKNWFPYYWFIGTYKFSVIFNYLDSPSTSFSSIFKISSIIFLRLYSVIFDLIDSCLELARLPTIDLGLRSKIYFLLEPPAMLLIGLEEYWLIGVAAYCVLSFRS